MISKKAQSGLITGIIFGVASLVIGVIIAFIITSTLSGANLLEKDSITVINETEAWLNQTGYTLAQVSGSTSSYAISVMYLARVASYGYNETVPVANYSVNSAGVVRNATVIELANVSISYTLKTKSTEELSQDTLIGNFTEGVDNVSDKIPIVLLVAAIVLILGILGVLVAVWQRMELGGGGSAL